MTARRKVRLTGGARADLRTIYAYLVERASVRQADTLIERLRESVAGLDRFSERGAEPKELQALGKRGYRQLLMQPYRIIYRVTDDAVVVLLTAHGRRDMEALLQRRLLGASSG